MDQAICTLLPWDSEFFGRRIARVQSRRLTHALAAEVTAWCQRAGVDCLYFLADADDPETLSVAEAHGFGMKDTRVTYARRLLPGEPLPAVALPDGMAVRVATASDVPALEEMAGDSFTDSRFYFDQRFDRDRVGMMFRVWARKSVQGHADAVLVLDLGGKAVGFIACRQTTPNEGEVPLAGLAAEVRGRGLGQPLYGAALGWFASRGLGLVRYATQGRNVRAQRLLQRLGFLLETTQVWYHRWFDRPAREVALLRGA